MKRTVSTFLFSHSSSVCVCVCVCVCACVYVCVCVYTLPPVGFFRLHSVCDIREKFGSTVFCCEYFWGLLPSSFISFSESIIFQLQRRKTPADRLLERRLYDIMFDIKMIYIDIEYKSAHYKNRQWRKNTKDKEATLI